jgi:hypothetical protein
MSVPGRRKWSASLAEPRIRQGLQSIALALLMASITVGAVKVFGFRALFRRAVSIARPPPGRPPRPGFALSHDQKLVPVPDEPPLSATLVEPSARVAAYHSASELFQAANQARSAGKVAEALRLSKQIEEFFPNSKEGIDTHINLGILYLNGDQAALALQEFALFRHIGSPEMKAEAYWGQAQALRKLDRLSDEQVVLLELLRDYPRSAYVAGARARLNELAPDAAPH